MGFFLFATASRPVVGPTQPPTQCITEAITLVKLPGREANTSPPPTAEVKNTWSYTSTTPRRLHGVVLNYAIKTFKWDGT
jgi:hypothetical protein